MQGGPRRGRSPITGPALLRAAQASQASPEGERVCPQGSKYSQLTDGEAKSRAAQASKKEASTHALTSFNCNAIGVGNGDPF